MQIKTSELEGIALDWAVAKAKYGQSGMNPFEYSTDWRYGGPLIDREGINVGPTYSGVNWIAHFPNNVGETNKHFTLGPTPLIAAMRCFCYSVFGDTVDVPDEVIKEK